MTRFVPILVVAGALVLAYGGLLPLRVISIRLSAATARPRRRSPRANNEGHAVAIQPDGKLVVAGSIVGPFPAGFVGRYTSDGTLHPTFGSDGKVRLQGREDVGGFLDPTLRRRRHGSHRVRGKTICLLQRGNRPFTSSVSPRWDAR
jgi:hypothetical protein